jgi:dihydropyrimidinase
LYKIISSDDIYQAGLRGDKTLYLHEDDIVTAVAQEDAERKGIRLERGLPHQGLALPSVALPPVSPPTPQPHTSLVEQILSRSPAPDPNVEVDLLIKNGQVVIPEIGIFPVNVAVSGGKITGLFESSIKCRQEIDAAGLYVIPGIIDPHVHLGLFAPLETELATETKGAILGGITTIGCFFNVPDSYRGLHQELQQKVKKFSNIDIIPHYVIRTEEQYQELDTYINDLGIKSFKMYMNGIPGILPHQEDAFILKVMNKVAALDKSAVICIHAENCSLVGEATKDILENREELSLQEWADTHPAIAEEEAVMRAVYFARKAGVKLYLVHITSQHSLQRLNLIQGPDLTIETTSPYLSIDNTVDLGALAKMEPPFRSQDDVEALWTGIKSGLIKSIGTDNVTMTSTEKMVSKGIKGAVPGYPALDTHLPVMLHEGVHKRGLPLADMIRLMTVNPARTFGVYPRKGTLMPGSDADIVLLDLNLRKKIDRHTWGSRSDFSLYEGKTLQGWPVLTIKGGKIAARNGTQLPQAGLGELILR